MSRKDNRSGYEPSWMKDWRRRKALGLTGGPTGHLRYGKFSRAVERSLELERPPLSALDPAEIERLEARL